MSDKNLRLQVVLNAVDKLTRPFKMAQASTRALAQDVKNSRDALKRLDEAGQKLTSFNALSNAVRQTGNELEQAKLKAQMMTRELSQLETPTKKQTQALEVQWRAVNKLETKQRESVAQMGKARAELYRMGISAKSGEQATARITSETERYNAKLKEQERLLKRAGEQQRKLSAAKAQYGKTLDMRNRIAGAGATSTAAGLAIGAPVLGAVKSYSQIEDAMKGVAKQVNALLDDKGGRTAQYYELQKDIQRLSETLPMENGAADIAALVEGGARMGVTNDSDPWAKQKKDLLNFAAVSAKASKAFEMPADQLAEDLGKIAFLYKIPIGNLEELGDTLNYLDDNAQSKGADIINVMQRMGDIADKMDYKQAAALGSTFLSLGAAPEVAASASKAMVRELGIASMQSKRFVEGMNTLGLNANKLEKGIAHNAVATIQDVLGRIKGLSKEKQLSVMTQLFGKEFGDDAQKLGLNIDEFIRQLGLTQKAGAKGSMQRESDIDKNSLSSQFLLLQTGVKNTFASLGETLRDPLLEVIDLAKRATGAFRRFVEENPRLAGGFVKVASGASLLLAGFGGLAITLAGLIGPYAALRFGLSLLGMKLPSIIGLLGGLAKVFRFVGTAVLWLGRAMLANPLLAILAGIAMAAIYIWQNWDTLGPKIKALWASISQWTREAWDAITLFILNKWTEIVSGVQALPAQFVEAGRNMIDSLMAGINEKWETLKAKLTSLSNYLPDWMKSDKAVGPVSGAHGEPIPSPSGLGFAGMYDSGGTIPSGQFGIVGERGPELVNGPARVTGRKQTAVMAAVAALGMSAVVPAAAAPLHPFSLPATEYRSAPVVAVKAASTSPAAGNHTEIHIHAAPNQSPQDIARMVMQAMDERDRKQQARARSGFSDRGIF